METTHDPSGTCGGTLATNIVTDVDIDKLTREMKKHQAALQTSARERDARKLIKINKRNTQNQNPPKKKNFRKNK